MLLPLFGMSQETPANNFFESHSGKEGFTSIYITKYMFDLFAKVSNDKEQEEFAEISSKLNTIKILTNESDSEQNKPINFTVELLNSLPKEVYKELMVIKDGGEKIQFLINEKNNKIKEFLMIVTGEDENVLIILDGDINLKEISKLSTTMNVKGFEHLKNVQ